MSVSNDPMLGVKVHAWHRKEFVWVATAIGLLALGNFSTLYIFVTTDYRLSFGADTTLNNNKTTTTAPLMLEREECKIIFHIHIPKSGGTSILEALEGMRSYVGSKDFDRSNIYISHGKNLVGHSTIEKMNEQLRSNGTFPMIVSAEVGIKDLITVGYPFFNSTCFFSTIRDPHQWLLSAENHMRETSEYRDGINGSWGFFDQANMQANMLGCKLETQKYPSSTVCAYTILQVKDLLCKLDLSAGGVCESLPRVNARNYSLHVDNFTQQVVLNKYSRDLDLWNDVIQADGLFCWKQGIKIR